MNGNHQRYSGYASGTGGAAEIRLPPKLGLYTIAEKEEEYSDDADGNEGKLKMSGTPSQKSVDGGVPSSQRVSSLQTSNKSGTLYGSAPDMSSASFQKSEETEHETKSDFTMQPLMTSTPRHSLEQLAQADACTGLNREEEGSEPTEEQLHDYDNKHSGDVKPSEEDELSERGTKNAQHESDSHVIPSMLDKQSADSETPFSFDDIPVELRPYISMDFDPTFMDDPECREEVYEIARQKMKAKETEQKAAKLCNDLTAQSGLPKGSLCPLGVRDSFDCDLSAADILKRKQDPMVHSDSSKKGLSTSAFALSTVGGISKLTRKESDDGTVTKEKGSKKQKKRSVDLKPSDLLKKKLKSEVKQAMVRKGNSQKQSEIIEPSRNSGPNDKQVSSVGNFHSESVNQQRHTNQALIAKSSESKGYGEADFTNPSELLMHLEIADSSPGYEQILYTTPSSLLQKTVDRHVTENNSKSPGYGKLDYATPSVLLKMTDSDGDNVEGNSKSPENECIDYAAPSELLRKTTDRGITEESSRSPGYGSIEYTTPSQLVQNKESVDMPMEHTTPSMLLRKTTDRGVTEESSRSPGYGSIEYTTPSQLVQNKESVDIPMEHTTPSMLLRKTTDRGVTEESSRSPGYGSVDYITPSQLVQDKESIDMPMEHTTSSKLLRKTTDRGVTEESSRSPGYGSIDYTTPSQLVQNKESVDIPMEHTTPSMLLRKTTDRGITEESSRSPGYGSIDYTTPSQLVQNKESVDIPMEHTTPSKLLRKTTDRGVTEESSRSPGYGSIDYTTPSQLVQNKESVDIPMEHTTPSKLLRKTTDRGVTEESSRSPGYGSIDYTTPSQLVQNKESVDIPMEHTTPSKLLRKTTDRGVTEESSRSPGYGSIDYTTPSQLVQNKESVDMPMEHTTPSMLLRKITDRGVTEESSRSPGFGNIDYTTPSQLVQNKESVDMPMEHTTPSMLLRKTTDRGVTEESSRSPGFGNIDYTTPSQLVQNKESVDMPMEHTTPSMLLRKTTDRGVTEESSRSPGYGSIDYTTPSQLVQNKESVDMPMEHTTPSMLLRKTTDRGVTEESSRSPGYGSIDYTTPSQLVQNKESVDMPMEHTTPSMLLRKTTDRGVTEESSRSPGYGSIDYTTPSQLVQNKESVDMPMEHTTPSMLLRKTTDRGVTEESSRSPGFGNIDYTTPSQLVQNKESVDMPMEHTTPSMLLRKTTDRGVTEESSRSPGYGSIDFTTPSQLVQNKESVDMPMEHTTPSKLLRKTTDRGVTEESSRSPGYGSIDYTTPSQLVQNKESVDMPMEHTTPSKLLRKTTDRGVTEESSRSPGYGSIDFTTPFQLVHMDCNEKQLEHSSPSRLLQNTSGTYTTDEREKLPGYGECTTPSQLGPIKKDSDATPSEISWNGTAREIMEQIPKSPENEAVPPELLKKAKEGVDVKEMSKAQGYGELIYSTPSVLLQKMVEQEVTKQYREHLSNLKTADTELRSYDSENFLKPRAPSMSTASPLSNPSSYQRSLLSGKQESSVSLLRNPSFLCISSSEESTDEESMIDNKRISEKKVEETSVSSTGYGTLPSIAIICSGDSPAKVPYEPETLPGSVQSLNEQFWNLCMSSPDIRRFIHENETSLFDDTSPSSFKSLEHCTNSPECTCMQCTSKTSIASQRENTFGRSHITARQSSRLPVCQKRPSKDGISGQNKKTLPNVRSTTPEARGFIMEKEVVESQNRKLQMEVSTLQTENKLLKDKNNRCQAKINDLEEQLAETKEALESLHTRLTQELSEATRKIKSEASQEVEQLQNRITSLTEENDSMKYEVTMLEKKLESSHKVLDKAMQNSEKNKTLEAYKMEVTTLKDEVIRVKSLLEQSERHLQEEEQRSRESSQSLLQLTEVKNLLQQQLDMGGGGVTAVDKQIKSLEKRLRVTEERLHQERADRANNLSEVEDKLLTENARLQAVEKELSRQLQREKDKNRNLDHKVKDIREENEKLRLSLPFDESALTSQKIKYDIPHGVHSSQRTETVKNTDYKHVISQVEQETGQQLGQEKDIVCYLWNTREDTYHQLQQQAIILQDLNFGDNITEGLKNLRDVKSQSDVKVQQLEEKVNDLRSEKATFEVTYKEQLTALVKERHDAFARLKTAEDLMEAIRSENEILKSSLLGQTPESLSASTNLTQTGKLESLQTEMMEAERKNQQLMRSNILLEGEISTLKVQLEARNKALEEAKNEAELAHRRLVNDEEADRKQQKIDKLTSQVSNLQAEVKSMSDKFSALLAEKNKLENDLVTAHRELSVTKVKVKESKVGELADSKQNQILKEEIEERDRRYRKLSQENDSLESQLQQVRQDLYAEQIQTQEYESQLEGYQQQLEQRGQMLDVLNGTEREQLAQFQILKDTMDSVSQELSQKQAQNKILQLELDKEKDKYEYMERELNNLRQDRKEGEEDRPLPSHQLQIRELEKERDHLKSELLQASKSLEQAAERHTAAENEIKQLQRELAAEKGKALQLSTEKGELEQNLEEIAEEHDALVQEKAQNEEDIFKLEQKLEEVIQKLEMEFRKHTENFTANNSNFPPEAIQMVEEIESLRSLLDTKAAEEDALKRRISRQQVEMDFLQRRVELLHNENECNRDDIMRMTGEVMTKMKEGVAVREMNQFLVKERDRLLKDNAQLENNIEKERGDKDRRKAEIADVIRKVEKSDDTSKMTSRDLLQKDAIIASLQAELQEVRRALQQQETENGHLRSKSEHLSKDIENLSSVNTSLENRLEAERSVLEEEKSQSTRRRDELMSTSHELELLKHDHHITLNTLNAEKQTVEVLKENVADLETENQKRKEEVHSLTMELESHKSQLATSKEAVDNLKQDKGAIYHEYDSMVRKLHEKDEKIEELQAKCDQTVETMQKELTLQKHSLEKEKTSTEHDLEMSREEITSLNEEMKQKEAQLNTFGRTLQELEETTRQKRELEVRLEKMDSTHSDSSLLLESMRKETMSLQETIARQQETLTQAQGEKAMLQDQLKIEKEKLSGQVLVLNKENTELRSQTEGEKSYLKDSLVSTQLRLSSVEASLSSVTEARDKAQINNRMLERSLEETKDQYQAETTCRKVAEQRAESLQSQLNETRKDRFLAEEKLGQAQSSLTKLEKELSIEKDRVKHLNDKTQELEATSFGHESSAKAKQDQIALLQDCEIDVDSVELLESLSSSEVGKMRQILESQKQQLNSKLKKTTLEKRQQIEILEEDRIKLTQQNQSLMSDLDLSREQVADKNKDNLKLQERILSLEEEMREQNSKLKQATDAVKAEEEMQAKLTSRFQAQEEELQKMKSYVSKKAEESGGADKSMWVDLNRLVQDLSHQLHDHLEMQTSKVGEQKDQESHTIKKYRKQCQDMESELNTEKALHTITKNSLQALEEDCQRLRHQLHAMRRRDNTSSDKKYKNRMEAINEIIARSQAQAQAMLAASGYYDHTGIKSAMNSPRVDLHCSPDNSVASDISFNSTGPMGIPPYQGAPSPPKFVSSPRK